MIFAGYMVADDFVVGVFLTPGNLVVVELVYVHLGALFEIADKHLIQRMVCVLVLEWIACVHDYLLSIMLQQGSSSCISIYSMHLWDVWLP